MLRSNLLIPFVAVAALWMAPTEAQAQKHVCVCTGKRCGGQGAELARKGKIVANVKTPGLWKRFRLKGPGRNPKTGWSCTEMGTYTCKCKGIPGLGQCGRGTINAPKGTVHKKVPGRVALRDYGFMRSSSWVCKKGNAFGKAVNDVKSAVAAYRAAKKVSRVCPQRGAFFDPANGGKCWTCPNGFSRTAAPVTAKNACSKGIKVKANMCNAHGPTASHKKAFLDPRNGGECWSCPKGFKRTAAPVTAKNACSAGVTAVKVAKPDCARLYPKNGKLKKAFFDPRKGGECWSCPKKFKRTLAAVTAANACHKGPVIGGKDRRATFRGKLKVVRPQERTARAIMRGKVAKVTASEKIRRAQQAGARCPKGFFFPATGSCYVCPAGFRRAQNVTALANACVKK